MRLFCFLTLYLSYPSTRAKPEYFFYPDQATLSLKAASGYRFTNHLITNLIYTSIMRKYVLLALVFLTSFTAFAQDFSNKGKDFWVAYGYHQQMTNITPPGGSAGGSQNMLLYFATDQVTTITVTIPGIGWTRTYTSGAGNTIVTSDIIPKTLAMGGDACLRAESNAPEDKGIHITSNIPIVAYAHVYNGSVSGATILYPTNTLGKEYYSVNYDNISNSANANSWFYVIAADTGTTQVEITPMYATITRPAGVPFTVTLLQGQVYNLFGAFNPGSNPLRWVDLTGSKIRSLASGNSGCKKIAVFSGSGRISLSCNGGAPSSDNYMVQALPKSAWGKNYLTVPTAGYNNVATAAPYAFNLYRVCVTDVTTKVYVDGVITSLPLIDNFYYNIPTSNTTHSITADKSIMVAQYLPSRGNCGNTGNGDGDPEVIYLSPTEQSIKQVTWNACRPAAINVNKHYINLVIPNGGTAISSCLLDGVLVPASNFILHPQNASYSYAVLNVSGTNNTTLSGIPHTLVSDSGFNAIAYGYGGAESYGYNAGTNVRDLSQQLEIETTYGIETSPSVCTNSPFRFKIYFPDSTLGTPPVAIRFDSLRWNLSNPALITPNNFPIINIPAIIDSTNIRNGRLVNWYSLPTTYSFITAGVDTLLVTGYTSTNEGCGSTREYEFPVQISDPPTASFSVVLPGCYADAVVATETTPQLPKATYKFWWEFFDPATNLTTVFTGSGNSFRTASHTFTTPGVKRIRHASITTPGCLSDTIVQNITLPDLPAATITGNTDVCINSVASVPVIFTGTLGTAEYIFSYNINGGATIISAPSITGTLTIPAPTNVAGTFVYNLIGVRNQNPATTLCTRVITGQSITINITADATVTLTSAPTTNNQTVCINNPITNITYSVAGSGTGGSVSGLPAGVSGTFAGGIVTITGTPIAFGTFNYTVSTTGPCVTPQAFGTITVTDDATLALTSGPGTDNQTLCINTPILTNITYAVGGSGTGGSVSGLPAGVTGVYTGGIITILGTPTVSGVFNYTVTTTGPCIKPNATGTITVTADATLTLTSAVGTDNQTLCLNVAITNITYAVSGSGNGGNVSGLPAGVTGVFAAGVVTISGTPTAFGTFNYTVSTTGPCIIPQAFGTITVTDDATLALTSGPGTDNQTLCINTAILTNITYAVGGSGTGGAVSGLPAGVTGVYAGGVITISGTPTISGVFNYTVTTTGPCVKPSVTGSITVTGDATIILTSAVGTNNQTRCINVAITNITYAVGGTGTGGSVSGLPPGVAGVFAAGVITISGTPTSIGSFTYTVITTGPCVIPTTTGTINVNPDASITLTSAAPTTSQELCRNSTIINITYAIAGGGTGAAVTGLPAGVTGVYAAGVFTISGSPTVAGLFNYTVTTTGTCVQNSLGGVILVNQLPTASFTYTAPSCETRVISFTDGSTPNIGTLDQWSWDFGDLSPLSTTQNPTHVYATAGPYTVTLTVRNTKGCISNPIASIVLNIDNRPQAGFIIPEVCLSDTYAQFLDTSKLTNAIIDRWDWNFGDPLATPANPNTSTLQNPTHSYTAIGTYNVRLIVWNFAKGCRDTITQVLQVNGSFPVANFTVNTPATLCANDSVGIVEASTVFPGVITKVEIYWDNAGFPAVFQTDNSPFTGKLYRHLYPNFQTPLTKVFTIRYRAYSGGVCVNDKLANITVNAAPRVQFNNMPNTCLLVAPFQITQASEIGGVPGSGVYSGPGVSATGLFTPGLAGVGTHTLRYTFTSTAAGCVDTMSNTITVLDTAHAAFSYVLPSCEQVPVSFTDLSTAPASVTLANTVWDFGDGTAIENHAPGSTFTHTFALPNTYTVTMYNVSAAGCLSTSKVVSITIDPNHSIALTTANDNQTVCINTNISQIKYNLGGGATNANVTGLPPGVTASVTGTQLTILGAPNTTVGGPTFTYNVETTGNTCVVARASGTITVGADHSISWNATSGNPNQTVCINTVIAPILYTLSGGATGATVTGLPAGITASVTGNQLTISGAPTTTVLSPFNFNIVTTGNACTIAAASGSITVEPDHSISWNATSGNPNQTVCINTLIAPVLYTLSGGATGASVNGLPAGITASVTGNLLTISGAPTTTVLSPFIFNIITTGNSCVLANAAGSIAVQPDHTITFNSGDTAQSVCINTPIDPIVYDLGGGATNVNVSGLPTGVTYTVVGNILTISGTPTSVPATPGFTITTTGNVCLTAIKIGEIVVHPYPVPAFTVDKPSYCIPNAIVKFTNGSTTPDGSGMTYIWNFGDGSPTVQSLNPTHWYTSEGPFNVRLSVTNIAIPILNNGQPGCTHDTVIVMNRIHPQPKADFVFSKPNICIGDNVVITDATDGKDGIVNQWNWNLGDGSTSVANPVTHTYSDTIAYTITMYSINSFGCNSDTVSKPFTVYPYPHVNAGPDKSVLEGGSVQLEATAFANDARYTWTPNLYLTDAGTLRPRVVSPKTDMTYRLTVTGRGGCQLSDNVFVKLLKFPVIPNTFTPNNDGRNDKWLISFLNTYPNNRVQIFTRSGNLVFESRGYNTPWDGTLKGKPLPFDTYYYIIEPGNGRDPITGYVTILK